MWREEHILCQNKYRGIQLKEQEHQLTHASHGKHEGGTNMYIRRS